MSNDKEKAKKMFFDYACRTFLMAHDGESVLEAYKKFGISPAQEAEWRREYISFWVSRLSVDDLTALDRLKDVEAGESLQDLIKWADQGDSYAKLLYANAIWYLANRADISSTMREQALRTASNLWQSLTQQPIEVSDDHKAKIYPYMKSLGDSTPEEYVLNYAKSKLAEALPTSSPRPRGGKG